MLYWLRMQVFGDFPRNIIIFVFLFWPFWVFIPHPSELICKLQIYLFLIFLFFIDLLHKIHSVWIKMSIQCEFCIHACACVFIVDCPHEIEKTSFIRVFVSLFYRNINCDLFNAGWKASDDNVVAIYSHVSFLCSHHKWDQGQCIFCLNGPIEQ